MRKHGVLALLAMVLLLTFSASSLKADAAWKETSEGYIFTQKASPGYVTGFRVVGKYTYYFGSNGVRQTGFQWIDDKLYYFTAKGRMVTTAFTLEGKYYYAAANGVLATDTWLNNCYYQEDGSMAVNTWVNGRWVGANGKYTGVTANIGWITTNGVTYYYNQYQQMVKGWLTVDGKTYYLQSSTGALLKGWITVSGNVYYAEPKKGVIQKSTWVGNKYLQANGVMATGFTNIGSKTYLFDSSGVRQTGWTTYQNKIYYLTKKGVLRKSRWIGKRYVLSDGSRASGFVTIGKKIYYFSPTTGKYQTGWINVDGKRYYLTKKGLLKRNCWLSSKKYYASSTGALLTGLNAVGGSLYYFDETTGKKATSKKVTVGVNTYYFQSDGTAAKSTWIKIGTKYYYFQSDYKMAKSTWVGDYYVNANGRRTKKTKQTGWVTTGGVTYCFDSNGNMLTGWQTISGNQYYFASTGAMLTGVQTIGTKKYFFYSDGRMATSITIIVGSKQYTINANGVIKSEESLKITENTQGDKIVNFALQYVGNPYVYGGISLTNGADCSGFVQTVFANFGIKVLRVANDQMNGPTSAYIKAGYQAAAVVDMSSIQPGDLLFYGSGNYASHVAIYIGNGQIVHASNSQPYPAGGIKISNYNYQTPLKAVRYWS